MLLFSVIMIKANDNSSTSYLRIDIDKMEKMLRINVHYIIDNSQNKTTAISELCGW